MRKLYFLIALLFSILCAKQKAIAQQLPNWSSFYENGFVWNPGLTAKWSHWEVNATHRAELVGFEDAPQYGSVGYQFPFLKRETKVTIGAFAEYDKVGPYENIAFAATYAYKIRPQLFGNRKDVLTFGLSAKLQQARFNAQTLIHHFSITNDGSAFPVESSTRFSSNVGTGLFYISVNDEGAYNKKNHYYIGASLLNLIPTELTNYEGLSISAVPHATLNVGYRSYPWRSNYFIEYNALGIYAFKQAYNVMGNVRMEVIDKYWISAGAVTNGDVFGQIGIIFNEKSMLKKIVRDGALRIGVKMDYSLGSYKRLAGYGYEIYLAYTFEME